MASIKVWVQLASQTEAEAIKLMLPSDSDISDVLLQVPSALNVGSYRPSELALHLVVDGVEDGAALSNRASLLSLIGPQRRMELNIVVKPKDAPAKLSPTRLDTQSVKKRIAPAAQQRHGAVVPAPTTSTQRRAASPAPLMPPVVPKGATPRVATSSPFRRTASATSAVGAARKATPPASGVRASSPNISGPSPRSSAPRTASVPRRGASSESAAHRGSISGASPLRNASATAARNRAGAVPATANPTTTTSRLAHAHGVAVRPSHGRAPEAEARPAAGSVRVPRRVSGTAPVSSAPTSARHETSGGRGVPTRLATSELPHATGQSVPSSTGVCSAFKPQWGNVLCASCKHSKQAHLILQREMRGGARVNGTSQPSHADPVVMSTNASLMLDDPAAHEGIVSPTHSYAAGMGRYNDNDVSLLDPPMLSNLSLGSPGNFSPD